MSGQWQPLSVRRGKREDDGPFEGLPPHLWPHVRDWMQTQLAEHSRGLPENRLNSIIALRLRIESNPSLGLTGSVMHAAARDFDVAFDIIDMILFLTKGQAAGSLESTLVVGASTWKVTDDRRGIERRVLEQEADAFKKATEVDDPVTDELREAWSKTYGLHADPSDAWDHSIKAVESALWPILTPNNNSATLSALISALAKTPDKFTLRLQTSSTQSTNIEALVQVLKLMWPNPDRHATGTPRTPTQEEAQNVVQLAIMIVSWVRSRALQSVS